MILYLYFKLHAHHRDLHSFPTRRSSDLSASIVTMSVRGTITSRTTVSPHSKIEWMSSRSSSSSTSSSVASSTIESSRSEEHTSELQSRPHLVCRLLLEKKKNTKRIHRQC